MSAKSPREQKELRYGIKSTADINPADLSSLVVPGKSLRIEWPPQELDVNLFTPLAQKHFVQIGMTTPRLEFDPEKANLTTTIYDNKTTKEFVARSFEAGFAQTWKNHLSAEVLQLFRDGVNKLACRKTTRFVEINGRVKGLIMIANFKTYRGDHKDHLAWIWIDPRVPKAKRRIIGASLPEGGPKIAPGEVYAGLYVRNLASYSFLRKAGFNSICATLMNP